MGHQNHTPSMDTFKKHSWPTAAVVGFCFLFFFCLNVISSMKLSEISWEPATLLSTLELLEPLR